MVGIQPAVIGMATFVRTTESQHSLLGCRAEVIPPVPGNRAELSPEVTASVVMLGGQGADEVLMGYRKYQVVAARQSLALGRYPDAARRLIGVARALKADNQPLASYTGTWRRYGRTIAHKIS